MDEEKKYTEEEQKQAGPSKALKDYFPAMAKKTQFFSTDSPDKIEEMLLKHIQESGQVVGEPNIKKEGYKVDYRLTRKAVSGADLSL